jgi:hypothetical protein
MSDEQQGSFIGGLALGMFAGAAGFFLFGTKDGAKTRVKIEKEWQEAKVTLAKDGIIKNKNASLGDLVKDWFGLEKVKVVKTTKKSTKKKTTQASAPSKKSTSPKTGKKFKGV